MGESRFNNYAEQLGPNSMNCKRPIFVVGAPRSGTSLLQRMLRSHPRISSPTGESHFIIPLLTKAASFGDLSKSKNIAAVIQEMHRINTEFMETDLPGIKFDIDLLKNRIHERGAQTISQIIDMLFCLNAEGEGKFRWLDKTPYYVLHIPLLATTYPDAQFIHIIRDGRDVVLSMLERAAEMRVFNICEGAYRWHRYVEAGRSSGRLIGPHRYLELRYEDMLDNPESAVSIICQFLGETYSDKVIDFQKSTDPNSKTPLLKKGLQKDNRDKWMKKMTTHQVRVFEAMAGETLAACDYEISDRIYPLAAVERIAYSLHQRIKARLNPHPRDIRL